MMRIFKMALVAIFLTFAGGGGLALASDHTGILQFGIADHGKHPVYRAEVGNILDAAALFREKDSRIAALHDQALGLKQEIGPLTNEMLADDQNPKHITVHQLHDVLESLKRHLALVGPQGTTEQQAAVQHMVQSWQISLLNFDLANLDARCIENARLTALNTDKTWLDSPPQKLQVVERQEENLLLKYSGIGGIPALVLLLLATFLLAARSSGKKKLPQTA